MVMFHSYVSLPEGNPHLPIHVVPPDLLRLRGGPCPPGVCVTDEAERRRADRAFRESVPKSWGYPKLSSKMCDKWIFMGKFHAFGGFYMLGNLCTMSICGCETFVLICFDVKELAISIKEIARLGTLW